MTDPEITIYNRLLMLNCLPEQIEPLRLAEVGRSFQGELAVAKLERLRSELRSTDGVLEIEMHFGQDERCVLALTGRIEGLLELTCQRCLEAFPYPVSIQLKLGIVTSETEARQLPEGYDVLVAGRDPIAISEIVEDEILLAIPQIPRHGDPAQCGQNMDDYRQEKQPGPFAVLKEFKSKS